MLTVSSHPLMWYKLYYVDCIELTVILIVISDISFIESYHLFTRRCIEFQSLEGWCVYNSVHL